MPETHQLHDSWYEIWFDSGDQRKHMKRLDEASVDAEINNLRKEEEARARLENRDEADLNFEVTKVTVDRESVDVKPAAPASAPGAEVNGGHATVRVPSAVTSQGTTFRQD